MKAQLLSFFSQFKIELIAFSLAILSPTVREIMTIIGFNLSNTSGYVPDMPVGQDSGKIFTITGGLRSIWTSSVYSRDTTRNYVVNNYTTVAALIGVGVRTTSANMGSIATANFTNSD